MDVSKKKCVSCRYGTYKSTENPCSTCLDIFAQTDKQYTQWEPAIVGTADINKNNNYDQHYISAHQPIETMQSNMSHEEFIGFLKGNILKYVCRLGKKDDAKKEAAKIRRYSEWLEQAVNGKAIDPRK